MSPEEAKVKLIKSPHQEGNLYTLEIEPGDQVDILFNPKGVNAVNGQRDVKRAFTIGTTILPDGELALSAMVNDTILYKEVSTNTYPSSLYFCRDFGAKRMEFRFHEGMSMIDLVLERINLQSLLKPASE
jgi:hypothetical protein